MCVIGITDDSVLCFICWFVIFTVDLLSLLQWKEHPEKIQEALNRVLRLNGEELVKFLQDVLDALFSMFSTEDGNSTSHSGLVFHVLVSCIMLEAPDFVLKMIKVIYLTHSKFGSVLFSLCPLLVLHCYDCSANLFSTGTLRQPPLTSCMAYWICQMYSSEVIEPNRTSNIVTCFVDVPPLSCVHFKFTECYICCKNVFKIPTCKSDM